MAAPPPYDTPALAPPPGVKSNFENPESKATLEVVFAIVCPTIAGIFVVTRILARLMISKLGFDDLMSVFAIAASITYSVGLVARIPYGMGRHLWDVRLADFLPNYLKWFLVVASVYSFCLFSAKMAILAFYVRLFGANKKFLWSTYALMAFVIGYTWGGLFSLWFSCRPLAKFWNPTLEGKCINLGASATANASLNVVTDIFIFILPLPVVYGLNLAKRVKIGLVLVFLTGGLVCVVSMVRLYSTVVQSSDPDATWVVVKWDIASLCEGNTAIIVGCLPVIKPLVQRYAPIIIPPSLLASFTRNKSGAGKWKANSGRTWGSNTATFRSSTQPGILNRPVDKSQGNDDYVELAEGAGSRRTKDEDDASRAESQEHIITPYHGDGIMKTVDMDVVYPGTRTPKQSQGI